VRLRQIAPVALILGLTVAGFFGARLLGERDARRESEHRAEVAAAQIRGRVEQGASLVDRLRRFMVGVAGRGVTSKEFASNAARWLSPVGFPAAAWVEEVSASRRATYERRIGHRIVTQDRRGRIEPVGSRSSYLPATLVSGIPPMTVPGIDLSGEPGTAAALARASTLYDAGATPVATRRDGTKGLFLIRLAPRFTGRVVHPGFVVVFMPEVWLRAAAAETVSFQLTVGGASKGDEGAGVVRTAFIEAGQRFDVVVPRSSVHGAAAVLPWLILAAGILLAALAGALGVNAARRGRAQEDLDRIFTLSPDLIAVADFEGHFTRVNPAVEHVLGYTEEELLARPYLDFVHPDDRERTRAEAAAITKGRTTLSFENRYLGKDGSYRVLDWTSTPVVEKKAMYAVARDVTERRRTVAELARLAGEQAALRRVATLVADEAAPNVIFASVAEEVARILDADRCAVGRHEPENSMTVVAYWSKEEPRVPVGTRIGLQGDDVTAAVRESRRPIRIDDHEAFSGPLMDYARTLGPLPLSTVAAPIFVEGRVWGSIFASTMTVEVPEGTESRVMDFAELIATAMANADAREEVRRLADEQAALRRVATLVARGVSPDQFFAAVAEELGRALGVEFTTIDRYEPDDTMTVVASWGVRRNPWPLNSNWTLEGDSTSSRVFRTRSPARINDYERAMGTIGEAARSMGMRSAVGVPIMVEDHLWGAAFAISLRPEPLPPDTEARIANFTELVATAIANVQARSDLAASRARIVVAADEARRRIERDLHDGVQQRLVSLALKARNSARTSASEEIESKFSQLAGEIDSTTDEVREIARGIHPAILSEAGLAPALKALARRTTAPVELDLDLEVSPDESATVAAYYVVSEALTNAVKHASASNVDVHVESRQGLLSLEICDDGIGGADPSGSGLLGLKDRVEALDGNIEVVSPAGRGTSLLVRIPIEGD
jgi:PAS domain S-box-containing protein